jgi:hypothetical protein
VARFALVRTLGLVMLLAPTIARADDAGSEMTTLLGDVDRFAGEAQGQDCAVACRAVDSMRSATERICEIDPGDPCARARDTLRKSAARVRTACPECSAATEKRLAPQEAAVPASPPQGTAQAEAVRTRGGCASCTVGRGGASDEGALPWALLVAGAAVWATRRRRRS